MRTPEHDIVKDKTQRADELKRRGYCAAVHETEAPDLISHEIIRMVRIEERVTREPEHTDLLI